MHGLMSPEVGVCVRRRVPSRERQPGPGAAIATIGAPSIETPALAKPNYSFEKRQREIANKKAQDEKQAKKKEARDAAKAANAPASDQTPPDSAR